MPKEMPMHYLNETVSDIETEAATRRQITPKISEIDIAFLKLDGSTQIRVNICREAIKKYCEVMKTEEGRLKVPPIILYFAEGGELVVADGHHRVEAAKKLGHETIRSEVRHGDRKDAIIDAILANRGHGLMLTRADMRNAAEMVFMTSPELSNKAIADLICVNQSTVFRWREDSTFANANVETRLGKDGKMRKAKQDKISQPVEEMEAWRMFFPRPDWSTDETAPDDWVEPVFIDDQWGGEWVFPEPSASTFVEAEVDTTPVRHVPLASQPIMETVLADPPKPPIQTPAPLHVPAPVPTAKKEPSVDSTGREAEIRAGLNSLLPKFEELRRIIGDTKYTALIDNFFFKQFGL